MQLNNNRLSLGSILFAKEPPLFHGGVERLVVDEEAGGRKLVVDAGSRELVVWGRSGEAGGLDYRSIAEKMTTEGHKMNHATARNIFLRAMKKPVITS